jgi:hypothetical protein
VDLSGISDTYVMSKLNKAFKSLKLKRDETNKLEFRKREGLHDFKMRPMIQHFIDDIVGGRKHSDDDGDASSHSGSESGRSGDSGSDDSDSESSKSESDSGKNKIKRKRSISYDVDVPA